MLIMLYIYPLLFHNLYLHVHSFFIHVPVCMCITMCVYYCIPVMTEERSSIVICIVYAESCH